MSEGQPHVHAHAHGGELTGPNTRGLHGMVLFGTDVLYLSHLPMFGGPHNFQVILEVTVDDAADRALRSDRSTSGDGLYTFRPEIFAITELDPNGEGPIRTSVKGLIHRGHFERGGPALTPATATVREVVQFAELDIEAAHDDDQDLAYLCFGRPGQLHLAHQITAKPDFDQILSVEMVAGSVQDMAGRPAGQEVTDEFTQAVPVRFARKDTAASRLAPGETVDALFFATAGPTGSHGFRVDLAVGREWYVELRELSSV